MYRTIKKSTRIYKLSRPELFKNKLRRNTHFFLNFSFHCCYLCYSWQPYHRATAAIHCSFNFLTYFLLYSCSVRNSLIEYTILHHQNAAYVFVNSNCMLLIYVFVCHLQCARWHTHAYADETMYLWRHTYLIVVADVYLFVVTDACSHMMAPNVVHEWMMTSICHILYRSLLV